MPEVRTAGTLANRYTLMLMSGSIPTKLIHFAVAHSFQSSNYGAFGGLFRTGVLPLRGRRVAAGLSALALPS
jgi:hypothetical protein